MNRNDDYSIDRFNQVSSFINLPFQSSAQSLKYRIYKKGCLLPLNRQLQLQPKQQTGLTTLKKSQSQ